MTPKKLRDTVLTHYQKHGRHALPWRKTRDPYKILVSEVMLQQTQVERVIPYYAEFLARFPNVRALSDAPLSEVLRAWQGLGYNRRAKHLHEAARTVVRDYDGGFPKTAAELEELPGVGPYTAGAVAAFAYNEDVEIIETNIRTVVMHHCFPDGEQIADADVRAVLKKAAPVGEARVWYWALMDYGSHLKRTGVRINGRTKGYVKQKPFKGSTREVRGRILKTLAKGACTERTLLIDAAEKAQLLALVEEGLVRKAGRTYRLAD